MDDYGFSTSSNSNNDVHQSKTMDAYSSSISSNSNNDVHQSKTMDDYGSTTSSNNNNSVDQSKTTKIHQHKIHLVSDLHLEKWKTIPIYLQHVEADILVLAGDIGHPFSQIYHQLISMCAQQFKHVILITGNHEYYKTEELKSMEDIDERVQHIANQYPNVYFLNRQAIVIDHLVFIGCTLWSLPEKKLFHMNYITSDFRNIKDMNISRYRDLFMINRNYIRSTMMKYKHHKIVVVTHHVPSYKFMVPKYRNDTKRSFYASNLEHLIKNADYWLCGHTHNSCYLHIHQCHCYVNSYGYPHETHHITHFNPHLIIDV